MEDPMNIKNAESKKLIQIKKYCVKIKDRLDKILHKDTLLLNMQVQIADINTQEDYDIDVYTLRLEGTYIMTELKESLAEYQWKIIQTIDEIDKELSRRGVVYRGTTFLTDKGFRENPHLTLDMIQQVED